MDISAEKVHTDSSGAILTGGVRGRSYSTSATYSSSRCVPTAIWIILAVGLTASILTLLPGRAAIPPLIESDYAYQLLAADRFLAGDGLTTLQPIAPGQPWDFQYEWGFLTKWPMGYSLLVAGVRRIFTCSSVEACRAIGIMVCALAMVGWFMWTRLIVAAGISRALLAIVAMSTGVAVGYLINPSTDALLAAAIPYLLLLTHHALGMTDISNSRPANSAKRLALAGLLSGGLFWLRYASVFIPTGIGSYLLWTWLSSRNLTKHSTEAGKSDTCSPSITATHVSIFALCAAFPVVALLLTNQFMGSGESMQAQVNLGHRVAFDMSPSLIWQAWWQFTDLGYYDHHAISHWVIALWPGCLVVIALLVPTWRQTLVTFISKPAVKLSASVLIMFLMMIVLATAMFHDKFDFVNLERYYIPLRPIYFLLFVGPLFVLQSRVIRLGLCVVLLVCCSWTFQQQWLRTYNRWSQADRAVSSYGAWSRCFEPHSDLLFRHLKSLADESLILVSNFHEYLALETSLPTLPVPTDRASLDRWVSKIATSRGIENPRVMFVLDPDNQWRKHWIKDKRKIETDFELAPVSMPFESEATKVYIYRFKHNDPHALACAEPGT